MTESEWILPEEVAAEIPCHHTTIRRNSGKNGFPKLHFVCGKWRMKRKEWAAYKASPPPVVIKKAWKRKVKAA